MVFEDVSTTPANRVADGHLMTQLGGHTIENSNTLRGGDWDEAHIIIGNIHIFTNASNEVRASIGAPTSSSDGALIGTAT